MQRVSVTSGIHGTTYFFGVTLKESHSFTNQITQNPVQEGAAINDHIYQQPITFTWEIGVSDCLGAIYGSSYSTSQQAFTVLEAMWSEADPLTITTEFAKYDNMLIKSFVVSRDKKTMNGLKATVVFQQIIVTSAVEISISQKNTSDSQTTGSTNTGTKSATTTNTDKIEVSNSEYSSGIKVKYGNTTYTLESYINKYANQSVNVSNGKWTLILNPLLSSAISSGSTFVVNGQTLSYDQFVKKYSG